MAGGAGVHARARAHRGLAWSAQTGPGRSSTANGRSIYLVDTNVLAYAYDPTDHAKQERARDLLTRLERARTGAVSLQVLGEFFQVVTHKIPEPLTAEQAERSVRRYARSWAVFRPAIVTVFEAIRGFASHQLPYYEGLVWATARLNDVPRVLSEDFTDGQVIEGVRFVDPFTPEFDPTTLA